MFDAWIVVLMFSIHQVTLKFTLKLVSFLFWVSIYLVSILAISWLASLVEQASLSLTWSKIARTEFLVMWLMLQYRKNLKNSDIWKNCYNESKNRSMWFYQRVMFHLDEPQHDKTNKMACAPRKAWSAWVSAQLIKVFAVHSMGSWGPKLSSCG